MLTAYCPSAEIISFAFRDGAFVNIELTPELIWRLRFVPSPSGGSLKFWTRPSSGGLSALQTALNFMGLCR
ncbi:uncharacterized protein N7529_005593 [Penicillium soppii]|uniref:uncharacterized protein n=1 Tax=Penicillium soppii TaxID=69789 RepID=UPI002548F670|nr:uncharacterized protein N7529_005593 [Penicillium soppii]KAJ5863677.1 hypothetical protein N7529_005593 [Penicillium soppii]